MKRVYNVSKDSLLRSPERGLRKITPARGPKPGIPFRKIKTFSIPTSSPQPQSLVDIMGLLIPCLWMGTCLQLTSPPELIQPISQSAFPFTLPLFPFSFSGLGLAIDSPSGSDMTFAIYDGSGVIEASSSHSAGEQESSNPNVAVFLGSIVLVVLLAGMLASRIE